MSMLPAVDPATGEVFAQTPTTDASRVPELLAAARTAQQAWAQLPLGDRLRVLHRFQDLLFEHRGDMAALITRESGKPLAESVLTDVAVTLDFLRFYLRHSRAMLRPRRIRMGNVAFLGKRGRLYWDPLGVVAVISPWNYPLLLPFGEIIPALIAGNAIAFKPSEFTTRSAVLATDLLYQAGLPKPLCALLVGAGEIGAALVEARPDKIFFTGSARTGRKVALAAAAQFIPVNLELGGSDPFIVLADADLPRAASGAVWARFTNGGQTCVAAKRLIVERKVYEPFLRELTTRVGALRLGRGGDPGVDMGPLIRPAQLELLERQLAGTVALGARVRLGGHRRSDLGPTFFEPTIVTDVPLTAPLWQEEVFGPILPVVEAVDAEEAIHLANASAFGLGASIWTGNRRRGIALARRIHAGAVQVNDATSHVGMAEAPHGGEKESGLGRSHGEWGLLETCRPRFVATDRADWMRKPWWYGYERESAADREAFLRFAFAPSLWARLRAAPRALRMLFNRRPI
jgi:acyl-CoA reductase-like NAD-dependent aldehyde dehydrogenase